MKIFNKHYGILLGSLLSIVLLNNCKTDNSSVAQETHTTQRVGVSEVVLPANPDSLSPNDYSLWLKQKETTFDEKENDKLSLSLLYKPIAYEAALGSHAPTQQTLDSLIKVKSGYHYFLIECLDKNRSLNNPTNKDLLLADIKNQLVIVKNNSDTISDIITEIFPARMMNQPHQILVLVDEDKTDEQISASIKGASFGLEDIEIHILQEQIKSFPKLKL